MSALVHSPPLEGWQAKPDGVVVKVLNNVTPIDLLAQSAVLFFNSPTCSPVTRCACKNNPFMRFVYGNHTDGAGGWNRTDTTRSDGLHDYVAHSG